MPPKAPLLAVSGFSPRLSAARVASALTAGLAAAGVPAPDLLELTPATDLAASDLDERLRRSRALLLATARLHRDEMPQSAAFELATRARQAGVPAYAVSAENALDPFDARILDLQVILEAKTPRALEAAGAKLAELL